MEVFRISSGVISKTLAASGRANRWNLKDQNVIYGGASRSLASLELIVHRGAVKPALTYKVMVISIADDDYLMKQIQIKTLPPDWRSFSAYSNLQKIGSAWYNSRESLVLKIPSAIIPLEYNFIINTEHPDFADKIRLVRSEDYFWDSRFF